MLHNSVQKIAIGTAQFGMDYGIANRNGQVHADEVTVILDLAWQNGINTLDTAKIYGISEEAIGKYVQKWPEKSWKIIRSQFCFRIPRWHNSFTFSNKIIYRY